MVPGLKKMVQKRGLLLLQVNPPFPAFVLADWPKTIGMYLFFSQGVYAGLCKACVCLTKDLNLSIFTTTNGYARKQETIKLQQND